MWIKKFFGRDEDEDKKEQENKLLLPRRSFLFMLPGIVALPNLIQEAPKIVESEKIIVTITDKGPTAPLEWVLATTAFWTEIPYIDPKRQKEMQDLIRKSFELTPEELGLGRPKMKFKRMDPKRLPL